MVSIIIFIPHHPLSSPSSRIDAEFMEDTTKHLKEAREPWQNVRRIRSKYQRWRQWRRFPSSPPPNYCHVQNSLPMHYYTDPEIVKIVVVSNWLLRKRLNFSCRQETMATTTLRLQIIVILTVKHAPAKVSHGCSHHHMDPWLRGLWGGRTGNIFIVATADTLI